MSLAWGLCGSPARSGQPNGTLFEVKSVSIPKDIPMVAVSSMLFTKKLVQNNIVSKIIIRADERLSAVKQGEFFSYLMIYYLVYPCKSGLP